MEASSEAYSEPCQISKNITKTVNDFSFLTIFTKSSIPDVWQNSEFPCKPKKDLREKLHLPFILIIFARLLPICLLNLINIFHQDSILHGQIHVTLISTYICLIMKIIIVFPNDVFLWTVLRSCHFLAVVTFKETIIRWLISFRMKPTVFNFETLRYGTRNEKYGMLWYEKIKLLWSLHMGYPWTTDVCVFFYLLTHLTFLKPSLRSCNWQNENHASHPTFLRYCSELQCCTINGRWDF